MGEAKRRKRLDPSYGRPYQPRVWITESEVTPNYLVMIDGYCFDSAIRKEDAELVAKWAKEQLRKHPLPRRHFDRYDFEQWRFDHGQGSPNIEAYYIEISLSGTKLVRLGGE